MIKENLTNLYNSIPKNTNLVAVTKTKTNDDIMNAYNSGQRLFGENKVQELTNKYNDLPKDIKWNMIGHLQTNKVKYIASFIDLIHSLDSIKLAKEINKQGEKNNKAIDCLIQIKISSDESKYGIGFDDFDKLYNDTLDLKFVNVVGLMGMASFTNDEKKIKNEFKLISSLFNKLKLVNKKFTYLSIGMSNDYKLAINEGGNMIRVGSIIFGER